MRNRILRSIAFVAMGAAVMLAAQAAVTPDRAMAAPDTERDRFVIEVFPVATSAVNFWDSWGARRTGGRRHRGTDIMSPRGTPIHAVADGVVTDFGRQRLSGYYVKLDHGNGWSTSYMHLNNDTLGTDDGLGGTWTAFEANLKVGATVRTGDIIGYVGDSGNAEGTQPHTHFEVRYDGTKENPYPYLLDAWLRRQRAVTTTDLIFL